MNGNGYHVIGEAGKANPDDLAGKVMHVYQGDTYVGDIPLVGRTRPLPSERKAAVVRDSPSMLVAPHSETRRGATAPPPAAIEVTFSSSVGQFVAAYDSLRLAEKVDDGTPVLVLAGLRAGRLPRYTPLVGSTMEMAWGDQRHTVTYTGVWCPGTDTLEEIFVFLCE